MKTNKKNNKIKFEDLKKFLEEAKRVEEFNNSSIMEGDDDLPEIENSYFDIK